MNSGGGPHEAQHGSYSDHPRRQPDPAGAAARVPGRQGGRARRSIRPPTRGASGTASPTWCAGRPRSALDVISDGEFGKAISWSQYALFRLGGFERRPFKPGAVNPFTRGQDRTRFAEFYADLDSRDKVETVMDSVAVGPITYTGQAELQADIDNFKAALGQVKVAGGLPAGRGAGERHPGPQERILQVRRRPAAGDRRRHAHRIQDDHRLRPAGAARRCARRRRLRPHGAGQDVQGVPHLARQAGRDHQLRDQGPAARQDPLSRLLGKLARPACLRRAVRRHRRSRAQGEGRRVFDRSREPAP